MRRIHIWIYVLAAIVGITAWFYWKNYFAGVAAAALVAVPFDFYFIWKAKHAGRF